MTSQMPGAPPVQGPSQPTHTDLIWATASSQAALDDPSLSGQDRQSYLEAEAATYTAAAHLGLEEVTAEQYAAELAEADAASAGMDGHLGEPTLADWVLTAPELEAGL
jgi:hypothetical protein